MQSEKLHNWLFRIALAVNIGLAISYLLLGAIAVKDDLLWRADFTMIYTGASMVRDQRGNQLYDLALQTTYQQKILDGKSFSEGLLPFNYPPHTALIFTPLAFLSRPIAFGIWTMLQFGLLIWALYSLWQFSVPWTRHERLLFLTGVLAFPPLFHNFLLGALSLLVLCCLLQWYRALNKQPDSLSGMWLIPASMKPQTIVLPIWTILCARRWRSLAMLTMGGAIILALCSVIFGTEIWGGFMTILRQSMSFFDEFGFYPSAMYNLKGILATWLGKEHANWINVISMGGFLISFAVVAWLWRKGTPDFPDIELRMAITLTLSLLFSLHLYAQDVVILILPATLFYVYRKKKRLPCRAYGIFLWSCSPIFLFSEFALQNKLGTQIPVAAMFILLGWLIKAFWDRNEL